MNTQQALRPQADFGRLAVISRQPEPAITGLLRWQEPLATRLRHRHNLPGRVANRLLNVELGLFLLADLLPLAPAEALPNLLAGQGWVYRERSVWTPRQYRNLSQARRLLAPYHDRTTWLNALAKYVTLPANVRAFAPNGQHPAEPGLRRYDLRERQSLFQRALL